MDEQRFGVVEPPKDLKLRKDETIEWVVTYKLSDYYGDKSFLIHANTSEAAERGVKKLFAGARVTKVEYYGTYQY